jgi:hypothetical protein
MNNFFLTTDCNFEDAGGLVKRFCKKWDGRAGRAGGEDKTAGITVG